MDKTESKIKKLKLRIESLKELLQDTEEELQGLIDEKTPMAKEHLRESFIASNKEFINKYKNEMAKIEKQLASFGVEEFQKKKGRPKKVKEEAKTE